MKITLPKRPKRKFKPQPRILLSGSIPRPLHGVNPRTIKGKDWWDRQRKKAYEHNNNHCHACGVFKRDAKLFQWLEAHEIYEVDYENYRMKFKGIVALCHCCHAVIHAGRTVNVYFADRISEHKFETIVLHGKKIFTQQKLAKPIGFRYMELIYYGYSALEAQELIAEEYSDTNPINMKTWSQWRLEFNGKLYPPKFETPEEWAEHYGVLDERLSEE